MAADFTSNKTIVYPLDYIQFTDTSTGTPTAWDWYFPNGVDSHLEDPVYTFDLNIGNTITSYNVSLNASNSGSYDWENKTDYFTAYPLNASFTANITSGYQALPVEFTDLTDNGTPSVWNWSFGDGEYSDDQNPTHLFEQTGLFNVTLNASNLYSWDIEEKQFYINVTACDFDIDFSANVTSGYTPLDVGFAGSFSGNGTEPEWWDWYIDDWYTDEGINITHIFQYEQQTTPLCYDIQLNAYNDYTSDWENKTVPLSVASVN